MTSSASSSYLWSTGATTRSITVSTAGSYTVQVTDANGCQSAISAATVVTVNALPATPTISTGGNPTTFCAGGSVTLTSSASSSYLWSTGATTRSITVSTAGSYTVQVTDANGCQSAISAATVVTVNALPATPTISTGGNPTTFCAGGSVTLTSSAGSSYLWSTGATTRSISVSTAGNYTVQVTDVNACQSASSASTAVTVNSNVTPSVSLASTSTSICSSSGTAVTFTAAATNGGSSPMYTFTNLTSGIILQAASTNNTYSPAALPAGAKVSVTMISNATCPSPATATSNSITMTVYSGSVTNPNAGGSAKTKITGPSGICPGPTATGIIFNAPVNLSNAATLTWSVPAGFTITAGQNTTQITVSVLGPGAIRGANTITLKAINPCDAVGQTITFTVTVGSFNAIDVGSNFSMCYGTNPTLTNILSGAASRVTWTASSGTVTGGPYPIAFVYNPPVGFSGPVTLTANTDTASGDCSASFGTASITITVNQPSVAPTSLSASSTTICKGSPTTLAQTGGSLGTGASWKWYTSSSYSAGSYVGDGSGATASLSVSPTTTTTYYLRAESATGAPCAANITGPAAGVTVTVSQPSPAPTGLSASIPTICSGNPTTLTQTGGSLGTGATWKWYTSSSYSAGSYVGDGSGATASLSVSPTTTTTYYLRAESTTGAPCAANITGPAAGVTVTVSQPSAAPTGLSASIPTICSGNPTTLTQTGGSLGTGATWKWYTSSSYSAGSYVGDGSGATASLSVSPTTTTTYYLRAESTTGAPCAANVTGPSAGVTVTVNQLSGAPTGLSVSVPTICSGNPTTLTQTGGSLGTGATWKWYTSSSYSAGSYVGDGSGATASLSVSPTTTTTYYLRAESITGAPCAANIRGPSAGVTVTVNQPSIAATGLSVSIPAICSGSATTLAQTGGSLGTGATWKWYSSNSYSAGSYVGDGSGATASLSVSPTTTTTYYLRAESTIGTPCAANITGPAAGVTATVNQPPSIIGNPTDTTVCASFPASFSVLAAGTGLTYQWYRKDGTPVTNGGTVSGATSATLHFSQAATGDVGDYYVKVIGAGPCGSVNSATVSLAVNQSITINTQPTASQTVCENSPVAFSVNASGNISDYQWRRNDTLIAGATSLSYSIANVATTDAGKLRCYHKRNG